MTTKKNFTATISVNRLPKKPSPPSTTFAFGETCRRSRSCPRILASPTRMLEYSVRGL